MEIENNLEDFLTACRYGESDDILNLLTTATCTQKLLNSNFLFLLAANGHSEIIEELLLKYPNIDVNYKNEEDNTALHWASLNGELKSVVVLLRYGASAIVRNKAGLSPVTLAESRNHDKVVRVLLDSYDPDDDDDECSQDIKE